MHLKSTRDEEKAPDQSESTKMEDVAKHPTPESDYFNPISTTRE